MTVTQQAQTQASVITSPPGPKRQQVAFWVPGIPKPGGSKRAFMHRHTGRIIVKEDCAKNADWRSSCQTFASQAFKDIPLAVPLRVSFGFVFTRPNGHFGSGKNAGRVRASAPTHPAGRPDVTKLVRSTEDALTGLVWKDDALIVEQSATKTYGSAPGCRVVVEVLNGDARLMPEGATR